MFFDIFRTFSKNVPEVWTIFVRNIWGDIFGIFGTLIAKFGVSFSMVLQVSKLWWFPRGFYLPKCSKTRFGDPGVFWASRGGHFVASSSWLVFARVQIIMIFSRSLSSKVLLNSFSWPWRLSALLGASLCSLLELEIRVFTVDSIAIFAFERLAGIANSHFHFGFYSDIGIQALSWYSEFAFSARSL